MKPVQNENILPLKVGDRIRVDSGRWRGVRKVIAIIPCKNGYDCMCVMGRHWIVLEQHSHDVWEDMYYPGGITFCFNCLGNWSFANETS